MQNTLIGDDSGVTLYSKPYERVWNVLNFFYVNSAFIWFQYVIQYIQTG